MTARAEAEGADRRALWLAVDSLPVHRSIRRSVRALVALAPEDATRVVVEAIRCGWTASVFRADGLVVASGVFGPRGRIAGWNS